MQSERSTNDRHAGYRRCLLRFALPIDTKTREEVGTRGGGFGEQLVAAVAVVADARAADENAWWSGLTIDRRYEAPRRQQPTISERSLAIFGPASIGDALAGKIDNCVCRRQCCRPRSDGAVRCPRDLVSLSNPRSTGQHSDGVAVPSQANV